MALGMKHNETRNRLTHYRGDLAICSAKTLEGIEKLSSIQLVALAGFLTGSKFEMTVIAAKRHLESLPRGVVLCVVEVFDCQPSEMFQSNKFVPGAKIAMSIREEQFGDYSPGRFAWRTRNVRRLADPVKVKGGQGFFYLPPDVEALVKTQI